MSSTQSDQAAVAACHNHEVFLSFRGDDTRTNYISRLYEMLIRRGVQTYIDNKELPRGGEIKPNLDHGITNSQIIPIISLSFATSSWCLDELVTIVGSDKIIIQVFSDVDPSDVKNQNGPFKKSFDDYEDNSLMSTERVGEWRKAMATIATRAGYHIKKDGDSHERELVRTIARELLMRLRKGYMDVGEFSSRMDSPVQHVMKLLKVESDHEYRQETVMVGIHGMGGLGKTTLAKMVYNEILHKFEYTCFLESVKDQKDLVTLQKRLASKITKENSSYSNVHGSSEATELLRRSLCDMQVLLIIDDADNKEQLSKLVGNLNWFGMVWEAVSSSLQEIGVCLLLHKWNILDFMSH